MKPSLASRRARVARVNAKRPTVTVTVHVKPSQNVELLRAFAHWIDQLLLEAGTPDNKGR